MVRFPVRKPTDPMLERLWHFLRGELPPCDFEAWICADPTLEGRLGSELYAAALDADYRSAEAIEKLQDELRSFARTTSPFECRCIELRDLAVVELSDAHQDIFRTLDEIKRRGAAIWWLSFQQCRACDEPWLVAFEERQNDIFCLRRLRPEQGAAILAEDRWPSDFDTYEALLEIGLKAGCSARWVDPLTGSSLPDTFEELARTRPGIRLSELARLLNLENDVARALAERVMNDKGVSITLGG